MSLVTTAVALGRHQYEACVEVWTNVLVPERTGMLGVA